MNYFALAILALFTTQVYAKNNDAIFPETKKHNLIHHNVQRIAKAQTLVPDEFLLPDSSPLKPVLDKIFSNPHVIDTDSTFRNAGFITKLLRVRGQLRIATHPEVKGYIFKLYLLQDVQPETMPPLQNRLVQRCYSAAKVRKLIQEKNIKNFTVPDKWLYELPISINRSRVFVLVAQDMQLTSRSASARAWKTKITYTHLQELHKLLKQGYISVAVDQNVSYTKNGTFACIDTEFGKRKLDPDRVRPFFKGKRRAHWDKMK